MSKILRFSGIETDVNKNIEVAIRERLKIRDDVNPPYKIIRESLDARKKDNIKFVYTLDVYPNRRPVVVGFGPSGMFAGLILAQNGLNPIIIERGKTVEERIIDVEKFWDEGILEENSNVLFGEGGAGTFSDGKLTTGVNDVRIQKVLEEFVNAGADREILYKQKPHIGTDSLRGIVKNIRKKIISLGGEIRFTTKMETLEKVSKNEIKVGVTTPLGSDEIITSAVILAIGHSARDTYQMLLESKINIEQKPFSMGVRIEHLQEQIDIAQYGESYLHPNLPPAEYKLSYQCNNGRGVYTFCMCPGGVVICAASEAGYITSNGMSYSNRDSKYANSGLLVSVNTSDFESEHPLAGIEFQRKYEKLAFLKGGGNYTLPKEVLADFFKENSVISNCLPDFVVNSIKEVLPVFGKRLKGFDAPDAILTGIETRSSSPVRVLRDNDMQCLNMKGIYPAGEGAGYAGGIMSAAVDGIKAAEMIMGIR